jgi:DNA-directed RNA polymerase subunit E'
MYKEITLKDEVRVAPSELGDPLEPVIKKHLIETYEGRLIRNLGFIVLITDILDIQGGEVKPGDGGAFYITTFKLISLKPDLHEVVDGVISEIVDFGAFVSLGALDALIHVSQITDDFLSYDSGNKRFVAKESKKVLHEGDIVRARVVALGLKPSKEHKIGLTMRQKGLGKFEWIKAEREKK